MSHPDFLGLHHCELCDQPDEATECCKRMVLRRNDHTVSWTECSKVFVYDPDGGYVEVFMFEGHYAGYTGHPPV